MSVFIVFAMTGFVMALAFAGSRRGGTRTAASGGRVLAGALLCLAVLGASVLFLIGMRTASVARHRSATVVTPPAVASPSPTAFAMSSEELRAPREPHTSTKTLRAYLSDVVDTAVERVGKQGGARWVAAEQRVPSDVSNAVRKAIGSSSAKPPKERGEGDTLVTLRWEDWRQQSSPSWPERMTVGTLVADVVGPRGNETFRARLDEKPWLERSPGSVGRRNLMVLTSGAPTAASRGEAERLLEQQKTQALMQLVGSEAAAMSSYEPNAEDLRRQVAARYPGFRSDFVDEVVVKVDRGSYSVWQAAGLLQVPPADVTSLAHVAVNVAAERRAGWASVVAGSGGMMLLLLVLYLVLNSITRGYFRTQLRAAVAVVLAGALVVLLLMMK